MNLSSSSNDNSGRLEQIVAYLDGELSADESAHVERQLARDEHYRQELQSIDRAWSALDLLPAATVDGQFSKTTMELVVQDARRDVEQRTRALPIQRRKRRLATALTLSTCVLFGMLAYRVVRQNPNRQLLADLPVVQYMDPYTQFEDVAFLERLHSELGAPPWAPEMDSTLLESQLEQYQLVSSSDTRENWLNQQSPEEKASLRAKFNRFQGLSAAERLRLRELHEQISTADDDALRLTFLRYQQWLRAVPPIEKYELRQLPTAQERAKQVAKLVDSERRTAALELTEEQLRELFATVGRHALKEVTKRSEKMPERDKRARGNMGPEQVQRWIRNNMQRADLQELLADLSEILPNAAREQLLNMSREERKRQMWNWLRQAWMHMHGGAPGKPGEVSQEQLEEFFSNELPAAAQEKLLALPRDQMLQHLERMFRGFSQQSDWQNHRRDGQPPPPYRPGPPRDGGRRRGEGGPQGGRGDGPPRPGGDRPRHRNRPFDGPPFEERPRPQPE
jgi:hypothetical protein